MHGQWSSLEDDRFVTKGWHNQQVYVNRKKNNKLLFSITGTRLNKLQDLGTDLYLAAGKLKDTNRYKEAESALEKAKKKYNKINAAIIGHSLGSTIGSYIKKPEDRFVGLDAGYAIGQPTREGEHYRVQNDFISGLGASQVLTNPLIILL